MSVSLQDRRFAAQFAIASARPEQRPAATAGLFFYELVSSLKRKDGWGQALAAAGYIVAPPPPPSDLRIDPAQLQEFESRVREYFSKSSQKRGG